MGSIRKFKRKKEKGLSAKEQEQLLQDTTDMILLVLAHQEYVKSIDKEEDCKEFVKNFIEEAREKALEDLVQKVS